jgi:protein CpxP
MRTSLIALALAAVVAVPVFAQTTAQPPAQTAPAADGPRAMRLDRGPMMRERMCRDMDAHVAARLAWTEAKVKPTEAQRAAWNDFARASRAAAAPMQALCDQPAGARPAENDLAARLAERERHMAAMLDSTRQLRAAVETLQPLLSDEQKAALAESARRGGHGHYGRHDQHRGEHHGGRRG